MTIEEKVSKIVQDAVESQMNWESYYSGENPEAVKKIMELIEAKIERKNKIIRSLMDEIRFLRKESV